MSGRLIGVVGPSGVGKDSVMAALADKVAGLSCVRRYITRAPEAGGEDYIPVSPEQFEKMAAQGAFCLSWGAHELRYGIPADVPDEVASGAEYLVNLSRSVLDEARAIVPQLQVLSLVASDDVLAARLSQRGRETAQDIARRLKRAGRSRPEGADVIEIDNSGSLENTVAAALAAFYPVRA